MAPRVRPMEERVRFWLTVAASLVPPTRNRSVFVLGYPRTGTNWFSRIMSHYFELPIYIPEHHRLPSFRPAVLHLHRFIAPRSRTIYVLRDGRDSVVSYYFKAINSMPADSRQIRRMQSYCPEPLRHDNLRENLTGFIRFLFEGNRTSSVPYHLHVREAKRRNLHIVRYEELIANGEAVVSSAVERLTGRPANPERVRAALEATSFERRSGRKRGEVDLHHRTIRKGIVGDWRSHFTPESARLFDAYAGDVLVDFDYETDRGWMERLDAGTC